MKSFFIILLVLISQINTNKWIISTKFDTESTDSYNILDLTIGQFSKGILYSNCNKNELSNLINEIDNYLLSSTSSDFLTSSLDNLYDVLNYAKKMILKDPCAQSEINEIKENLNKVYQNLKQTKGKSFQIPIIEEKIFDTDRGFIHPGGLYVQEDFDRVKKKIEEGDEKILEAYQKLLTAQYAQPNAKTYPVETIVRGGGVGENYINAARGASIAFQNGLRWKLEGNLECAQHAVDVLMAWARTTTLVSGDSNYALASGLYGY